MSKAYIVKKYQHSDSELWNSFVKDSINGTFLFDRDFMEYHHDRFLDYSLMVFDKQKLIGLFPANSVGAEVHSHQGLTYGGLIISASTGGEKVRDILSSLIDFFKSHNITTVFVKSIPAFYHTQPAQAFTFFLSEYKTTMYQRDLNLAIDYRKPLTIHKSKLKHFEKRKEVGFLVKEEENCADFWNQVLIPRLKEKHNVSPVHTVDEMMSLKNKFPEEIRQFTIRLNGQILAGITVFKTNSVIKSQYGAVTKEGEKLRALDFLFITLIQKYKKEGYTFFDMGTVTENNFGLLKQKEELGCRIYTQDFYRLDISF
ncbi:hypothetical protein GCM10022393_03810 [Aquimarina addita]|uniref:BioF2-like acetyltransferase domain-containing protein n=1 Tax=Aquimarina addita TaxID=870485 RepID=A0ABP7X9H8_9FLAO